MWVRAGNHYWHKLLKAKSTVWTWPHWMCWVDCLFLIPFGMRSMSLLLGIELASRLLLYTLRCLSNCQQLEIPCGHSVWLEVADFHDLGFLRTGLHRSFAWSYRHWFLLPQENLCSSASLNLHADGRIPHVGRYFATMAPVKISSVQPWTWLPCRVGRVKMSMTLFCPHHIRKHGRSGKVLQKR